VSAHGSQRTSFSAHLFSALLSAHGSLRSVLTTPRRTRAHPIARTPSSAPRPPHTPPRESTAHPTVHAEPAHAEPAHAEPAHAEPAHAEPAHAEPAHAEPAHAEPAHAEP